MEAMIVFTMSEMYSIAKNSRDFAAGKCLKYVLNQIRGLQQCIKDLETARKRMIDMYAASVDQDAEKIKDLRGLLLDRDQQIQKLNHELLLRQYKLGEVFLTPEEQADVDRGDKIPAIKKIRVRTGLGLKDAKSLADDADKRPEFRETYKVILEMREKEKKQAQYTVSLI